MPGLPASRVIHDRFSSHHQPTAAATMTARCDVTRPATGRGSMDAGGTVTNASTSVAVDVPCRVQAAAASDRTTLSGEQDITLRRYTVALTADLDTHVDDIVTITEAIDPALAGRALRVVDVLYGSEVWQRTLTCIDTLT